MTLFGIQLSMFFHLDKKKDLAVAPAANVANKTSEWNALQCGFVQYALHWWRNHLLKERKKMEFQFTYWDNNDTKRKQRTTFWMHQHTCFKHIDENAALSLLFANGGVKSNCMFYNTKTHCNKMFFCQLSSSMVWNCVRHILIHDILCIY